MYRLKAVKFDVDFRKNETTNLKSFEKSKSYPGKLRRHEVFLFVSKSKNQLLFVLNNATVDDREIIDTRRWRILRGTWNPYMLGNYAAEAGIDLQNIKRFEDLYTEMQVKKRGKRK